MMKFRYIVYSLVFSLLFSGTVLSAQTDSTALAADSVKVNIDSLVNVAETLRNGYRFEESCNLFYDIIRQEKDSLAQLDLVDRKIISQNGLAMAGFVADPKVVARKKLALEDFYLWYPLEDRSWRPLPNVLDTLGLERPLNAVYVPEGSTSIYYTSHDDTGARNLYYTEEGDSLWTVPALLNEYMTSSSNDIYPMLSPDRRMLYFASDGLFGCGGYDLYYSEWDEERKDWGEPKNMGFPYSTPSNDYLYMNTPDGEYSLFASDRGCTPDSVWLYVLEYDPLPVRKEMTDPQQLEELCRLVPKVAAEESTGISTEIPENLDIRRYMEKITLVNALRDTIFARSVRMDQQKNAYAMSDDAEELERLTARIRANEKSVTRLQDSLEVARKQLQDIEMEFLFNGVVIDPQKLMEEAEKEVVPEDRKYTFRRMSMGDPLAIVLQKPEPEFDYSFRIQDTSSIAESNTLPEGIVYQIQMMTRKTKAKVAVLKGISPIFEIPAASGGYVYRAGLFNTYKDALSKLNVVKRKGFRYAKIVASQDGKAVSVSTARALEKKLAASPDIYEVVFGGDNVTSSVLDEILALTGKDVAKGERNGKIMYIVGPFDQKADADAIVSHLRNKGVSEAARNILEKK